MWVLATWWLGSWVTGRARWRVLFVGLPLCSLCVATKLPGPGGEGPDFASRNTDWTDQIHCWRHFQKAQPVISVTTAPPCCVTMGNTQARRSSLLTPWRQLILVSSCWPFSLCSPFKGHLAEPSQGATTSFLHSGPKLGAQRQRVVHQGLLAGQWPLPLSDFVFPLRLLWMYISCMFLVSLKVTFLLSLGCIITWLAWTSAFP